MAGYQDTPLQLKTDLPEISLKLVPRGVISIRVYPPITKLKLNDLPINNPTHQLPLNGEEHKLEGFYTHDGKTIKREWQFSLKPGQRLKKFFDLTVR